jgi:hypothetical protein
MIARLARAIATLLCFTLFGTQLALAAPAAGPADDQPFIALSTSADTGDVDQAPPAPANVPPVPASTSAAAALPATPPATIIASAHTVYLSNSGGDPNFPLDQTIAYQKIYAALQSWGRFQIVGSPAQADLIFDLYDQASVTGYSYDNDTDANYPIYSPAFQLIMVDPRTNQPVWTIDSPVNLTGKGATFDKWTAIAVTNLVSRVRVAAGEPLSATETADLTTVPQTHFGRIVALSVVGFVALSVGSGLLLHHLYENSLANGKAQQDAFCQANNIPPSECAGG